MSRPKAPVPTQPWVKQEDKDERALKIDEQPKHKNGKLDHPKPRPAPDGNTDYNIGG